MRTLACSADRLPSFWDEAALEAAISDMVSTSYAVSVSHPSHAPASRAPGALGTAAQVSGLSWLRWPDTHSSYLSLPGGGVMDRCGLRP